MKKHLLIFSVISLFPSITNAQVGVNTQTPTEILTVNGTTKISDLPTNGATNAIYTINSTTSTNNTASTAKDQPFNAVKTVVVDKNGVLGYVDGLPIQDIPDVKSIQYKSVTAEIKPGVATASYLELGNLAVRFDGTEPEGGAQPFSYKLINNITAPDGTPATADNSIANCLKIGSGGAYGGQFRKISATKDIWYVADNGNCKADVGNRDFMQAMITLVNTKEVYRLTISVSKFTKVEGNVLVASPGQVTLFLERLSDAD